MASNNDLVKNIDEEKKKIERLENELSESRAALRSLRLTMEEESKIGFAESLTRSSFPDTTTVLRLQKWNTPTIYNGWEQVTHNPNYARECFNLEPIVDHMPEMGSLVGLAVTVKIQPSIKPQDTSLKMKFYEHVASLPAGIPKIIVVQDMDKPIIYGSMWGEVAATFFRSIGVVGCIVDGGVRDLDEMRGAGFHALSRGVCVGHCYGVHPVEWDKPVHVFGVTVKPGQLIHADKHGMLVVPAEDEPGLADASDWTDDLERKHTIVPGKEGTGKSAIDICNHMGEKVKLFGQEKIQKYGSYKQRFQL